MENITYKIVLSLYYHQESESALYYFLLSLSIMNYSSLIYRMLLLYFDNL